MNSNLEFYLQKGKFTCDDGHCIDIIKRCDSLVDCSDQSDEIDCYSIVIPGIYNPYLSPTFENNAKNEVIISLRVTSIRSFSILDLTLSYDLITTLKWKDPRLTFANLKVSYDNIISMLQANYNFSRMIWIKILFPKRLQKRFGFQPSSQKVNLEAKLLQWNLTIICSSSNLQKL